MFTVDAFCIPNRFVARRPPVDAASVRGPHTPNAVGLTESV